MAGGLLELDADEALVDAVRGGDPEAFRLLVDRHRDWLTARCRRHLGGDAHAAEDMAQECFVALQRTLVSKDAPMRVRPWLSVVARNRCIDETRKLRAVPTPAVPETAVFDPEVGTEDEYLARAWSALTGRHRAVLELRELGGLSYDEIARNLAVTSGAVEALLFRARSALRREYARAGGKVAAMAPMQEAVARASGGKGVLSALAESGGGLLGGPSSTVADVAATAGDAVSNVPAPTGTSLRLLESLQARLLTSPAVETAIAGPAGAGAGGPRLRAALAAVGLLLGGAATVAGTVATTPSDLPAPPPPAVVTVPDASGSVTAPTTPTTPVPAPAAEVPATPAPTAPPAPAATAPSAPATPEGPATTAPSTAPPTTVVDVPAVVEGATSVVEETVGGVVDVLTGLLTAPR